MTSAAAYVASSARLPIAFGIAPPLTWTNRTPAGYLDQSKNTHLMQAGRLVLNCRRIFAPRSNLASGKGNGRRYAVACAPSILFNQLAKSIEGAALVRRPLSTDRGRVRRALTQQPHLFTTANIWGQNVLAADVGCRGAFTTEDNSFSPIGSGYAPRAVHCLQHAMADHGAGENRNSVLAFHRESQEMQWTP